METFSRTVGSREERQQSQGEADRQYPPNLQLQMKSNCNKEVQYFVHKQEDLEDTCEELSDEYSTDSETSIQEDQLWENTYTNTTKTAYAKPL